MKYASLCSISVAHGSRDLQQNFCAFSFRYMISWMYLMIHILKHLDKTTTNYYHYFVHTLVFYKYSFLKSLILQNHEERCPDKVVECPSQNCTVKLARRLIEEHLMTSCPWRIVCCPFCSENHPKSQELVSMGFFWLDQFVQPLDYLIMKITIIFTIGIMFSMSIVAKMIMIII